MSAAANATSLLSEFERIKGYRQRGYCLSVTDQDRLIEVIEMLCLQNAKLMEGSDGE